MNRQLSSDTIWASKPAESIRHLWFGTMYGLSIKIIIDEPQGARERCHVWFLHTQVGQHVLFDSVQFDSSISILVFLTYLPFML